MCQDTPKGIQLRIQIDGIPDIRFAHVTLPIASAEVIEVRDGADPSGRRKCPAL